MTGKTYPYSVSKTLPPTIGIIVLGPDETIEADFRHLMPPDVAWYVSRLPSAPDVTPENLAAMAGHIGPAAALFPEGRRFDAIGYACTSGASEIGTPRIAAMVGDGVETGAVTNPVSALVAACGALNVTRLGFLSPYTSDVSNKLRTSLNAEGVASPVFGSFDVAQEAVVARIDAASIQNAAIDLMNDADVDALFLSCTNLRTLDVIAPLEQALGKPVFSSNQVLAWHLLKLAGVTCSATLAGQLFTAAP